LAGSSTLTLTKEGNSLRVPAAQAANVKTPRYAGEACLARVRPGHGGNLVRRSLAYFSCLA